MGMEKRGVIDGNTPQEQEETKEASREDRDHPKLRAAARVEEALTADNVVPYPVIKPPSHNR